jgi:hypothetical protein
VPDPAAFPTRQYDLIKEFVIALVAVALLTAGLAAVFSSPDVRPVTLASWSRAAGPDFTATAVAELAGTSGTAEYGPPYNHTPGAAQKLGPVGLQNAAGVRIPVDTANDFVIGPLAHAPEPPGVRAALAAWAAAPVSRRQDWSKAYSDALAKSPGGDPAKVAKGDYGPVPVLTARLLDLARSGALDGELPGGGKFYETDYTRSLLFLSDGSYLESLARTEHLGGGQLPGPGVAVALHVLVPDRTLQVVRQRRRPDLGRDGAAQPGAGAGPLHPRRSVHPALDASAPVDLALVLPRSGGCGAGRGVGALTTTMDAAQRL